MSVLAGISEPPDVVPRSLVSSSVRPSMIVGEAGGTIHVEAEPDGPALVEHWPLSV